jgi:NADH dehydrogenase [ubiquinone] 1 alpha subcomplex assembly factor 5
MNNPPPAPQIFDRTRRIALRNRAGRRGVASPFLWHYIAEDLADRLVDVRRDFPDVLIIGPMTAFPDIILGGAMQQGSAVTLAALSIAEATQRGSIVIQEDNLPFDPASFDLIITAGTLDSVNDLPGALVQMRRCLRPDGLLLGSLFGAGTLMRLKAAIMAAEGDRIVPHIHPQIDLRSAADLLSRAGFALPVADQDILPVRYGSMSRLIDDLRDMGVGNALSGRHHYFGKAALGRLMKIWDGMAGADKKVEEHYVLINISGWAPSPDQPKPAKRGSGKVSLASALRPPTT